MDREYDYRAADGGEPLREMGGLSGPRRRILFIVGAAVAAIAASAVWIFVLIYFPYGDFEGARTVEIPRGSGAGEIARLLEREGVIRSSWFFITYTTLRGENQALKPGIYSFVRSSLERVVAALVRGGVDEVSITVPEGWTAAEIGLELERRGLVERDSWTSFAARPPRTLVENFSALGDKPAAAGLEGYLFPDTYRFFVDAPPEDVARRMLENFEKKFDAGMRAEAARRGRKIFQVVTMASLVEREVVSDEDRAIVAGILWKRLEIGMPLQVDATIAYITGKRTTRISRAETEIDSPYNTYKYRGLPRGPIGNPGLSAIRAALLPKSSPYLYYLSAPDGTTIFSRTLEEHNAAKAKYLR